MWKKLHDFWVISVDHAKKATILRGYSEMTSLGLSPDLYFIPYKNFRSEICKKINQLYKTWNFITELVYFKIFKL